MAVKRTSGVSPIISSIDRRVKTVESAQSTLNAQYANAISVSVPDDDAPEDLDPDITSGVDKKYEYKRVLKAYIYGTKVTGNGSRCELYFGEDPQIAEDDPVDVQGVHGTSTDNFNISPKQFKVFAVDSPPWNNGVRATQPWRNTPTVGNNGDTITNTVWFNPVVEVPSSYPRTSGRELITTRRIDTVDIDGTTVTVNLNSTHRFELGDIISVDLPEPAFGIDGLFRISDVPDTSTIVYELNSPVESPMTLDSSDFTGGEAYVYPVARRYVKDGTVWVDKSVTPNKVWVWNVLRWYDTAEPIGDVSAVKDGIAPSPVTNFTAVTSIPSGLGYPVIDLSWTPPTTRSNGDPIANYLDGYEIWYKRSTDSDTQWKKQQVKDGGQGISVFRISDSAVEKNVTYNVRIYVVDIMAQFSTAVTANVATPSAARPSAVTNLAGTSEIPTGSNTPIINLTWTPATTRVDGGSLAGALSGYDIWFKRSTELTWKTQFVASGGQTVSSHTIKDEGLLQNVTYNIRVYSVDSQNLRSDPAEINVVTSKYSDVLNAPSKPTVSSRLRTITVTWDGKDSAGNLPVPGVVYIEFHESTTSGFTPSASTLIESTAITNSGNFIVLTGRQFDPANPSSNPTYYYKTRFVRQISPLELETSAASAQSDGQKVVGVVGPDLVANTLTVNEIDAGYLTAALVRGDIIRAGASATSARVEIKKEGIFAFNGLGTPPDPATFQMLSSDGSVLITGGSLTSPIVTGGTIQTTDAINRGIKINSSGLTAFSSSGINTFTVAADSGLVTINGGSLTSPNVVGGIIQTSAAANTGIKITTSNLIAYNSSGTATFTVETSNGSVTISGGTLTSGTVQTSAAANTGIKITTSNLIAYNSGGDPTFTVEASSGNVTLSGGTFTGSVVRTNAGLPRAEMNSNGIFIFNQSGGAPFRAYSNGAVFISEGYTGSLDAGQITTGTLTADRVSAGTFRTRVSGSTDQRVIMSGNTHRVAFYATGDSDTSPQGSIEGSGTLGLQLQAKDNIQFRIGPLGGPTSIVFVNSSGMGFNSTAGRWQGQLKGSATSSFETGTTNTATMGNDGSFNRSAAAGGTTRFANFSTGGFLVAGATVGSDERLKENISTTSLGLSFIKDLNPVEFTFKNPDSPLDEGTNFGIIAQQLKQALANHGVDENNGVVYKPIYEGVEEEYYSVNHMQLISPLIKAIQELSSKNEDLEARLAALEGNG